MKTSSVRTYTGPGRIVIARFAPRGMTKGYRMFKALAPGPWFKSVSKAEYIRRFTAEILDPLDPRQTYETLHELSGGAEPVLLCWERPPFTDTNWCHRRLVAEWFEKHLHIDVPELAGEPTFR